MAKIKIKDLTIDVTSRWSEVKVKFDGAIVLFLNQDVDTISELIKYNFNIVSNHYKLMVEESKREFDSADIDCISISIVLDYLYMYNRWRSMYKRQENRDLKFDQEDLFSVSTYDIIFHYLKEKYPTDWRDKSAILLGMSLEKLNAVYKAREEYYNK